MNVPRPALPLRADQSDLILEDHQVTLVRDDRRYRVRGLEQNQSSLQLKVSILASREELVYLDTVDLVKARARQAFVAAVASELYVEEAIIKRDLGHLLLQLEQLQAEQIDAAKQPHLQPQLTDQERDAALELLRDPQLLQRIVSDLDQCGTVGEETNKLVGYLATVSRKLTRPLAVLIQSSSSAGKSSLMDAILDLMPPEEQLKLSGLTGQSLFYLEQNQLRHKILAVSEDEGVTQAAYALKLLQSEGELRHVTVGKTTHGRLGTQEYRVNGPVQIFLTTTSTEIDEELLNRCLVLTVDESREQTQAIHQRQRWAETRAGKQAARAADKIRRLHQNAQRLLRPLQVYNPFAPQLTFTHNKTRLRRDHAKYLALINAVTLLHQYQRPVEVEAFGDQTVEYLEVTAEDIRIANRLAADVLGRTLDELSPHTRRFLVLLHERVADQAQQRQLHRSEYRFTRRAVREATGWSDFQVRTHLNKLVELEYVLVHRGSRGRQFVYELLYDGLGQDGEPFLMGLVDSAQLHNYEHPQA